MKTLLRYLLVILSVAASLNTLAQTCANGRFQIPIFTQIDTNTVVYGSNTNVVGQLQQLNMTIYQPTGDTSRLRPAVIVLYGGSFVGGSRRDAYVIATCQELAKRGYVAAAIDYRLGILAASSGEMTRAVYRAQQDALSATRYLVANKQSLRIRQDLIYMWGFSAGAITALQAAYMQQAEAPADINVNTMGTLAAGSGNAGFASPIRGIINNAGGIGDTSWITRADSVPVSSVHNSTDGTVFYDAGTLPFVNLRIFGSFSVHRRLLRQGISSELKTTYSQGLHLPTSGPYVDTFFIYSMGYLANRVCLDVTNSTLTTLASASTKLDLQPYPQPSTGLVSLLQQETIWVELYNTRGQLVKAQILEPEHWMQIQDLPAGMYTYRAWQAPEGQVQKHLPATVGKVIKQ